MEMIQNRNPEGLSMLHDRYSSMLKALIMKVLHNDAEADDLLRKFSSRSGSAPAAIALKKGRRSAGSSR
jgi:hypothetical protein